MIEGTATTTVASLPTVTLYLWENATPCAVTLWP
jgi:hypothetical protein